MNIVRASCHVCHAAEVIADYGPPNFLYPIVLYPHGESIFRLGEQANLHVVATAVLADMLQFRSMRDEERRRQISKLQQEVAILR